MPEEIINEYKLRDKANSKGHIFLEVNKGMYGLPQAGLLANELLEKRLNKHGYYQSKLIPGLWKHKTRPIQFTLVVDDYGVKYVGQEHAIHLKQVLEEHYKVTMDWAGERYVGIHLKWDIFLHERLAFRDTLQCINKAIQRHDGKPMPKIIVHCYTGSFEECIEYMKRGYSISVSGYIMKDGDECDQVRRCLREGIVPLDELMIETDAPYMGVSGNKDAFFDVEGESFSSLSAKKRKKLKSIYPNVPSVLPLVLKAACNVINVRKEQRGEASLALEELGSITTQNAKEFFGLL
jgi:Tat protein secretion system quality control protein TatD with DNase activity